DFMRIGGRDKIPAVARPVCSIVKDTVAPGDGGLFPPVVEISRDVPIVQDEIREVMVSAFTVHPSGAPEIRVRGIELREIKVLPDIVEEGAGEQQVRAL